MRFLVTMLSLAIISIATITMVINVVEARERSISTLQQLIELRDRLYAYQMYVQQRADPPKVIVAKQQPKTTTVIKTSTVTKVQNEFDTYLDAVRTEIHELTNLERKRAGLKPLLYDAQLGQVAEKHSEDMLIRDYFSHSSPEGCTMACRLAEVEYAYWAWGENIAWRRSSNTPDAKELARHFFDSWMNSSGHRKNILSENFTHEGIGLSRRDGLVFITASFTDPQ